MTPGAVDLAELADGVSRDGDRDLTSFTTEELAATRPAGVEIPDLPEDPWFAGLDTASRRVALASATRSLAARGLVASSGERGVVHGDLRLVHELRAAAPTVVQAEVEGTVAGRRRRVRHLCCRAHPGLVLHLAAAAGLHRGALRSEATAGLCLAGAVVDLDAGEDLDTPVTLPPALRGGERRRARQAIDDAAAAVVAVAHHRGPDRRAAAAHLGLWATAVGVVLCTSASPSRPDPDADDLRLVSPAVALAATVGLFLPCSPLEAS